MLMAGYVTFLAITLIAFFSTRYNRRIANERNNKEEEEEEKEDKGDVVAVTA